MASHVDAQCAAFQAAIDVLARPWNGQILTALQAGPLRFSEIAAAIPGAGDKILSARLKDLEARGLITRHVHAGPPLRVTYDLTPPGREFHVVATAIERWGRTLVRRRR
jgi:DNA-binding HxlR family transcriptional regulator